MVKNHEETPPADSTTLRGRDQELLERLNLMNNSIPKDPSKLRAMRAYAAWVIMERRERGMADDGRVLDFVRYGEHLRARLVLEQSQGGAV